MKHRYFILPLVIISLILLVIDYNKEIINKKVFSDNKEINYPFFNNDKIDKYINNYLNEYIVNDGENNIFIDYDYIDNDDICYMIFYKYILNGNVISSNSDSFEIDIENRKVNFCTTLEFDMTETVYTRGSRIYLLNSRDLSVFKCNYYDTETGQNGIEFSISLDEVISK